MAGVAAGKSRTPARIWDGLAWLLLALLFAANVYKAWTLAITIDEAFTYNEWVAAPLSAFFTRPSGGFNNHPLNTLLCSLSVALLGTSEFTLRLPNVLMGLVYLGSVYRLARLIFGPTRWMLLAVALTCANPLVLDHLAVARGYGLGLAFWTLGAYWVTRWMAGGERTWRLVLAGAALGLAVAGYLTEAFAVAALAAPFLVMTLVDRAVEGGWRGAWEFLRKAAAPFAAAGLAVGVPILWGPVRMKRVGEIDGEVFFRDGVKTFLDTMLKYRPTAFSSQVAVWKVLNKWPFTLLLVFLALLVVAVGIVVWRWWKARRLESLEETDRYLLLFGSTALLAFLLLRVEPAFLGHVYFGERRLLFAAPILLLTAPLWLVWMGRAGRAGQAVQRSGAVVLTLLAVHLVSQFTTKSFYGWEFDAGTKGIANELRRHRPEASHAPVRLGGSWFISHSMNFYRRLYGMDWVAPLTLASAGCFYDYYAVLEEELPGLARFAPRVLYRNGVARTVLAEIGPEVRARLAALREAGFSGTPECWTDLTRRESWAAAGTTGVNGHLLRDVMEGPETDHQRWTFERPAFLFDVARATNPRFRLDLRLPAVVLRQTGPMRLTLKINGRRLEARRLDRQGDHRLEWLVPGEWIRPDGLTLAETEMDPYFVAPDDGQKLGYLFVAGGFVPGNEKPDFPRQRK